MAVLLDLHGNFEILARNTNVGPFVVSVLAFRLCIDASGKTLTQIGQQSVTTVVLMLGSRLLSSWFVPVLAPVIRIAGTNPPRQFENPVGQQRCQVAGIGRNSSIQRVAQLLDRGMLVRGVAEDHPLPLPCRG